MLVKFGLEVVYVPFVPDMIARVDADRAGSTVGCLDLSKVTRRVGMAQTCLPTLIDSLDFKLLFGNALGVKCQPHLSGSFGCRSQQIRQGLFHFVW